MATLCENCVSGHILPGEPKGSFKDGAYTYGYRQDSDAPEHGQQSTPPNVSREKVAIIVLTDMFGLDLKNPKILADSFAERLKCDVLVPDLFNGHPAIREEDLAPYTPDLPKQNLKLSWIQRFKFIVMWVRALPALWNARPAAGLSRAEDYVKTIKSKQVYAKIGIVGYCYGGGLAIILSGRKDLVDVVVACHPGPVDIADVSRVATPLMMLCSEEDQWLPPPKRDRAEAALKTNATTETKFAMFPGTVHGFAARPNLGIAQVKEAFEKAFEDSVEWLATHL